MAKVLVLDKLDETGVDIMRKGGIDVTVMGSPSEDELLKIISTFDGLVIRSATTVTPSLMAAASILKVVGRAGVGVDNIDVPEASRRGIIVMNTPLGNIESAAEHAVALMFAAARNVSRADAAMKSGRWDKKKFTGMELAGKTLGVIGLGKVGQIVCRPLRALDMQIIAFDPYLPEEKAGDLGVRKVDLDTLLAQSDFITIHTPLTDATRNLINADALNKMKKTAVLVNCARGGVVDENALCDALKSGVIKAAAVDVFASEPLEEDSPLRHLDNVVLTPHLGASTEEAQVRVAEQIAEQFVDYFTNGKIRNAVNISASLSSPDMQPYAEVAEMVGETAAQLVNGAVTDVEVGVFGEAAVSGQDAAIIAKYAMKGVLARQVDDAVNLVNVDILAKSHGLVLNVTTSGSARNYKSRIMVRVKTGSGSREVAGTLFENSLPRIVSVDDLSLEITPSRHALAMFYNDKPGMVGKFGTILGKENINIAAMAVGRRAKSGQAVVVLTLDEPVPRDVAAAIAKSAETEEVYPITLSSAPE
ncbi:MAG: phosphoglycerate dehydrogenase [Planctomycetes bacterium]|nr:phosphoglycerate dehydrogenase [Planctomycetota bacterium]